jgi:PAS domain S-box-containing protein
MGVVDNPASENEKTMHCNPSAVQTAATDRSEDARLFRTTFERAVIGIAHVSPQGRWLRINQYLCDLLGYDREELAARTWWEITHPDDLPAHRAYAQRLLAGELDAYELDTRFLRKDGAPVWVHLTTSLVRTAAGASEYFIAMAQDIVERKRLEEERALLLQRERATNAQLRALQALTDTALSHLALDDLLGELLGRVTGVLGTEQVGILLLEEDGRTLTVRAACGLLEAAPGYDRFVLGQGFPGRIAASRVPLITDAPSADDFDGAPPELRERLRAAAGVPLLVEDPMEDPAATHPESRLVGVLLVGSATPRRFTEADVQLLQLVGDRVALAIDRSRLYAAEQSARQCAEAALARARAGEEQATERAAQLHTILETIADGVAVSGMDGRLVQTNRAFRELLAADRLPQFETMSFVDRAPLLDFKNPATGEPFPIERHPVARALRGEVITGPDADVHVRAFDGRELEANISAAPLRDREPDGRIVGAVSVVRDVTERKQLEREREEARVQAERQADQLDRVFEAVADGLVVWDAVGQIVRVNPAAHRILGRDAAPPGFDQLPPRERETRYAARDEQGHPVPAEEPPFARTLGAEVGAGTGPEARDVHMRALDGREIELHASLAPLRDREGHLVGAVSVLHDQTERNRLAREREAARADELAAREASRRLEQFLAVAAHDLRTPLTATVGYLALAERQTERLAATAQEESPGLAPAVAAVHKRVADAGQGAERLARLLTLLFDTSAIRADRLELHRAPCDLAALVGEWVAEQRAAAPGRSVRLHTPPDGAPIPVEVDADRIGQVVANYLTNALKYSPPDRPVDVSVEMSAAGPGATGDGWARVAVRDRGPGIPEAERGRVWELFHQAPGIEAQDRADGAGHSVANGSMGLGLYISKAIVEAHGGRVGVESTKGRGSTFWFTLPLVARPT